jgi:hypothetical protein
MLSSCLAIENKSESHSQDFQSQLRDEFEALAIDQSDKKQALQLSLTNEGICQLIINFLCHSVNDKDPKLLARILKLILLLLDKRQLFINDHKISSFALFKVSFNQKNQKGHFLRFSTEDFEKSFELKANQGSEHKSPRVKLSADLNSLLGKVSELLPSILPATSGFSRQAIDFLDSKWLCVEWSRFELDHLHGYNFFFKVVQQQSTALPAHSVVCAVSDSEDAGHIFDHVWVPFGPDRLQGYTKYFLEEQFFSKLEQCIGRTLTYCIARALYMIFFASFVVPSGLAILALYPVVLMYVYLVHGFQVGAYDQKAGSIAYPTASDETACGGESGGKPSTSKESHHDVSGETKDSNKILESKSCVMNLQTFLLRPAVAFQDALKGNQSVSRHMLCLPGMGSLKMLQVLVDAPIDVFEAPAVRAAVEGMWSRFRSGFFVRFALYVIQLLLFSAFACWSIATNASYSGLGEHEDVLVRASFVGGCVAAGIGCYFLGRELLQCCSCVANEGLKDYIEFWNAVQVCSHTLELTSFAMFVFGSDPISTRLVATYAVFGLWIGLLYFTKAIRQISFLLEILTAIVSDMIPFIFIMVVLIMAVTVALQVLTADLKSKAESNDENATFSTDDAQSIGSFGLLFGFAMRVAEGRQDIAGSALDQLARAVYEQPDFGHSAMDAGAFVYTIYLCFYFLALVISVVALNALIALMGSSYERVMEKKISQR